MRLARVPRALLTTVSLILLLVATLAVFRLPVIESLRLLAVGAAGDKFGLSRTAIKATPLLLAGLGMVVAWRGGMYNIGGEGQFLMGGLGGALIARLLTKLLWMPAPAVTATILAGSLLGGAIWASVAGWLFARRGVEVVISTILLNFVAVQLLGWAVSGPLQESKGQLPLTDPLPDPIMLYRPDRQMDLHLGVALALLAAAVIYLIFYRTVFGFRLRLVGANPRAARANRVDVKRIQVLTLALSGALCGLAGGVEYTGIAGQLGTGFAQGWGFLAIPVALLGGLEPIGTVASALFFGAIFAGSENLSRFTSAGTTLLYVVQGAAVLGLVGLRALSTVQSKQAEAA